MYDKIYIYRTAYGSFESRVCPSHSLTKRVHVVSDWRFCIWIAIDLTPHLSKEDLIISRVNEW